jgi:hypothetical protein
VGSERVLGETKMAKLISRIILGVAVFALPVCHGAESVPFTQTPMYKYLCEIAQEKSPTYKRQLPKPKKQEPQKQSQKQPEKKTDTLTPDIPYKPTFETTPRPVPQRDYKPMSSLTPDTAFAEAIDILRHSVKPPLNIVVFWRDLEDNADVDRDTPVGMEGLSGITIKNHLELILASVSAMADTELSYAVEDGIIRIATKDSLPKVMKTRVYDITDLTARPARYYQYGAPYMSSGNTFGFGRDYGLGRGYDYGTYPSGYGQGYGYDSRYNTYPGYSPRLGTSSGAGISFR